MSEWIQVKHEKKKKAPVTSTEHDHSSAPVGGMVSERAAFWGETNKKAAAKLEAYDREQGRHSASIAKEAEAPVAKITGIPNAEAIGAAFTCERFGKDENLLKKRLRSHLSHADVDVVVRQIVNMLDNDFRKATDCKWTKLVNGWLYLNKGANADKMPLGLISDDVARKELVETLHMLPKDFVPGVLRDYLFPHFFRASLPDPKKKAVEGDAHLGAKIVIQILLQKWPGALEQSFLSDNQSFAGTILAPTLHHDKLSLAWILKQLCVHTQEHCLALWARVVDDCFSGKSVESDPISPLQQVAHYLIGDKGCMRSFRSTSVPTVLSLIQIASHNSQDAMKQKISALAASAAKNALDSFKIGDIRFSSESAISIAQCNVSGTVANDQVTRLLSMAMLSIGTDHSSAVIALVRDNRKQALAESIDAIQHELASTISRSVRDSMSSRSPQSGNSSAKSGSSQGSSETHKASGGLGFRHVVVALTLSAIGGYFCIRNKCSGFCSNFHAICDAWNGKL